MHDPSFASCTDHLLYSVRLLSTVHSDINIDNHISMHVSDIAPLAQMMQQLTVPMLKREIKAGRVIVQYTNAAYMGGMHWRTTADRSERHNAKESVKTKKC